MKLKKILALILISAMMVQTVGCDTAKNQKTEEKASEKQDEISYEVENEEDIHIRDKDLLYENQNNTEIVTMYLTVSTGNEAEGTNHTWEEINTYSAYDYEDMGVDRYKVAGLIQVGDENGPVVGKLGYGQVSTNCTVQIRGQSSSRSPQKNYKIKVRDKKGDWRGQTTIALNKHQTEGLRFRNKLGFDLLSDIDQLMSLRTTFVHLYVKDTTSGDNAKFEDYGIYTQVEQLNKTALQRHGLDKNGHLYKINLCEFYRYEDVIKLKDDPDYDKTKFEEILEIKGNDDHTKLINLLDKINDYSIPIEDILEENFDVENITYWLAYNILLGNIDTQNRNFYMYSAQNSERWYIYPWDLDAMLRRTEYNILRGTDYNSWESGISNYWGNVLFQRCLKSESFRKSLNEAIEALHTKFNEQYINSYVNTYVNLIKPYVYTGKDNLYAILTPKEYDTVVGSINYEIEDNYKRYYESYKKPMPFYIGVPEKTKKGYTLSWDPSFDFEGEDITYTVELSNEFDFKKPILKKEGLTIPTVDFDKLPKGQYFVRVTAHNARGMSQLAFDCYRAERDKIYGTKSFFIADKGKVVEDTNIED